jgi:O-antigen/teichoic acid export membrane protein
MRSAIWSVLGKGGAYTIRIGGNLILTRILFPEAFGLMATANTILLLIQFFADTGVKTAIIQNPKGNESEFINTAWIINILRGFFLGSVVIALAWPVAFLYHETILTSVLLIMSVHPIIAGFENPALPVMIKTFRVQKQVGMELISQIISLITTIVLARIVVSVYALAIGFSLSAVFRLVVSYIIIRYKPKLLWNKEAGAALFHFGKYVFLNTLITALASHIDVLAIGKLLNMEKLSFYNIGKNMGNLILTFSIQIVGQSYLPAVSSVHTDIARVQRIYRRTVTFFLTIAVPISIVIVLFSYDIIRLLYDPRYQLAYISMFWIGLAGIIRIIGNVTGMTFFAVGRPALETVSVAFGLILVLLLVPLGSLWSGLKGASIGVATASSIIVIFESILLMVKLKFSLMIVLRPWLQVFLVIGVCGGIYYLLKPWLSNENIYNAPFMIMMSCIALAISVGVYRYLEGPNPFRDEVNN